MRKKPRILVVTPEITFLPQGMGNMANHLQAKGGGLADVSTTLVSALFDQGVDIHVALPHYRKLFKMETENFIHNELRIYKTKLPNDRIHLAEDRAFYYKNQVYNVYSNENINIALKFQREVINNILPRVKPDLIHCNDWMTSLIPAAAKRLGIPSLFTIHNLHTVKLNLSEIEEDGIDTAEFWRHLYFERMPVSYDESHNSNPVDLLTSGVFAADFVNTVSRTFLNEMVEGYHSIVSDNLRREMRNKVKNHCAAGILNSPDPSYDPLTDKNLVINYEIQNHVGGKLANKRYLQELLNLENRDNAPVMFWPSRLDPVQKGCQLLSDILFKVISKYWAEGLQVVIASDGPHQKYFKDIVRMHQLERRVAIRDYDRGLSSLAYAASDFMLMPSLYEPCGLPQMICQKYGSLPIVRDTGGLHDTVNHLNVINNSGNGFVFEHYDSNGLSWAIDQAMGFYNLAADLKEKCVRRVMKESTEHFNYKVTAKCYMDTYDRLLGKTLSASLIQTITEINQAIPIQETTSLPLEPIGSRANLNNSR